MGYGDGLGLPDGWAELPGPADLVKSIVKDLGSGYSVFVGLPREVSYSEFALEVGEQIEFRRIGILEAIEDDGLDDDGPLSGGLYSQVSNQPAHSLRSRAVGSTDAALAWTGYARRFWGLEGIPRLLIAMSISDAKFCESDKGLRRHLWPDYVSGLDTLVMLRRCWHSVCRPTGNLELRSSIILEAADDDLVSAQRLAVLSLEELLCFDQISSDRIWAAQVRILFPAIERAVSRLRDAYRSVWDLPYYRGKPRVCIRDVDRLEIGDMRLLAKNMRISNEDRDQMEWLYDARNSLAHVRIIPWATLVSSAGIEVLDVRDRSSG